jgi:hypothetical protein
MQERADDYERAGLEVQLVRPLDTRLILEI